MDWRLRDYPDFLKDASLIKVVFPDYWDKSVQKSNNFYKMIQLDAETFVKRFKTGQEYLVDEKIQDFWHTHCIFCTEKITTRKKMVCYCTEDHSEWICMKCFEDFKDRFCWRLHGDF